MSYQWKFFRAGGFDQVKLDSGAALANLDQLDQKLWVALACPTHGLEFDSRTLELVDTDKDSRVRVPEIIAAAKWATTMLKNPDDLIKGSAMLSAISVYELTHAGQEIIATYFSPFEIFVLIALYYYALISALAWFSRYLERRLPQY